MTLLSKAKITIIKGTLMIYPNQSIRQLYQTYKNFQAQAGLLISSLSIISVFRNIIPQLEAVI